MTSRTPMGAQSHAHHQRALSGSAAQAPAQRPSPQQQRSISQSQAQSQSQSQSQSQTNQPSSPLRRDASSTEQSAESPDLAQIRVATPVRTGSRLRQELYNETRSGTPSAPGSPPSLTPSRVTTAVASADEESVVSPTPSQDSSYDPENPPLPMPKRNYKLAFDVLSTRPPPAPPAKRDSRPKQYSIETPSDAPRYQKPNKPESIYRDPFGRGLFSSYADFFPWHGNHHEDEWTMEAIQKGTWDRGSQSEVSSARLAVMPSLRQKTGLNALSTIFMGVMNQRRNSGYLTAPSTFKPPPRVTLTDSKREVWLRDLANPVIPLRRLSRTIPHGIRGKTLLDQCLKKHVPTERAVWLAKCVGANEIRSFKRKGGNGAFAIGGEFKWIREWTIFVEQFVESVVSAFTETDWKHRVTYAIRLATVLYAEHLLDRDHYLDWIIAGLEASSQSRIPMWILIAQICWSDLLHCRKYGRRLVFALANHLDTIHNDPDKDILIQLSSQLVALLATLIKENPESFVQPSLWIKYQNTLQDSLPLSDRSLAQAFDDLNTRNTNLLASKSTSAATGSQRVVQLLDTTIQGPRDPKLATRCWASQSDKTELIKTTVEWATSSHRPGFGKIYVAAALIREWSSLRTDSTTAILDSLDSVNVGDSTRKYMVYRLVTELVRSGHFSVPQYIQWLIARGSCHDASEIDPQIGPCSSRLLVELPVYCLPEERRRDRANLLRRAANFDVTEEARDIDTAKQIVDQMLNLAPLAEDDMSHRKSIPLRKLLNLIRNSSCTLQTALGAHLRDLVMEQQASKLNSNLSVGAFASLRAILETVGDFTMLADVLVACIRMSNVTVLSACVDTIHVNLDVFFAMNRAEELFDLYLEKLKIFGREHGLIARPLLSSLSSLAPRMPNGETVAKELHEELLQSDKSNAIDACSPISDNMVTQNQGVEGEVAEQIDKLLASGTSVDHPTMNRLFRNVIPLLEGGWAKCDETRRSFAALLGRLRVFDTQHFDKLMGDWLSHIRTLKDRKPLADLLPLMISIGCLPMSIVLQTAAAQSDAADGSEMGKLPSCAVYLQELLRAVLSKPPKSTPMNEEESYRFSIYQYAAKSEHSKLLLSLMRNAIMEYSDLKARHVDISTPLDDSALQKDVLDTLRLLVVLDSAAVAEALKVKELTTVAAQLVRRIVVKLLIPDAQDTTSASFDQILGLANEMTMPFCQLTLNLELSLGQGSAAAPDGSTLSQFDIFAQAMDKAIEARNIMWTSMLPCLSDDITQHLKSQANGRFLDLMPSTKSENLEDAALGEDRIQLAKNLLGVIEAIASGQTSVKPSHVTSILADKLSDMWELLTMRDERVTGDVFKAVLQHWLPTLLRLISLYSNVPETPSPSTPALGGPGLPKPISTVNHEPRARVVLTLCALMLDLEARSIGSSPALEQELFDVAMLLADGLPDDLKMQCAKSVIATPIPTPSKTATSDPRVYYVLSALPTSWADNLLFAHRDKASLPHSAAARGLGAMYGIGPTTQEKYSTFSLRRWEVLSEPTPNVGENDTSLSMALFETIKIE